MARTGALMFLARIRSSSGTESSTARLRSSWKSAMTRARFGPGRSRATLPRSHGERVVTAGLRRRARISSGPCRSRAGLGPRREDREGGAFPEVLLQQGVRARGRRAVDVERGRAELAADVDSQHPEGEQQSGDDSEHGARAAQQERRPRASLLAVARRSIPAPPQGHESKFGGRGS